MNCVRLCFLFALLVINPQRSSACIVQEPLTNELKRKADSVFVGEAIEYTPRPEFSPREHSWKPAVIRFRVERMISGAKQNEIEVYWINGTFGESHSIEQFKKDYGKKTRVGITKIKASPEAKNYQDKPWVLQGSCTPPYMWREN